MSKNNIAKIVKTIATVLLGNALYAVAVTFFVVPSQLVLGGFTGLSIAISHFVDINVSYAVLMFHLIAFVAGSIVLGRRFAVSTAASTFLYPLLLNLTERIACNIQLPLISYLPINALISALLIGISLGILTRSKTSTGGTEVIPLIIHQLTHKSVGKVLLLIDGVIMLLGLTYANPIKIVYGILIVVGYSAIVQLLNYTDEKLTEGNA
ncbi:MAG: YitT family protein [Lachnospiraceae bacterium]|nr:YitT family protein [Lachnospiraceae bacterium]